MHTENIKHKSIKPGSMQSGFRHLKKHWKDDLLSGFSVSLIALPLCLGIAIASGFPPIAGIFAAIVGGLFVSRINGSTLTIAGPAAGLIVVNLGAIESLGGVWTEANPGGLPYALAAFVIAGGFIALFGLLKVGKLGDFFPTAAVHGMLAAIGIIIIVKQIFPSLGVKAEGKELYEVILEIPAAFKNMDWHTGLISLVSILILAIHSKLKSKGLKKIPAPLIVLLIAIPTAYFFHLHGNTMVDLPNDITKSIVAPDFSKIGTSVFWIAIATITLVSAIESILSALAVDQLDPKKRKANLNQDLIGLGAGTSVAGAIGGLPMISEIVRSSANIGYGAKSQWSNFFHGLFLLIFILLLRPIIELIPVSALAGMLIFTGYRLASPKEFKHMWEIGKSEFLVFVVTCVVVLATDLLIGIAAGIVLNLIIILAKGANVRSLFFVKSTLQNEVLELEGVLSFANYLGLKKKILSQESNPHVVLDFSKVEFIDHNVMMQLLTLKEEWARERRNLEFRALDELTALNEFPTSERRRGGEFKLVLSKRDKVLGEFAAKKGYAYNPGSVFGYEFKNFKLLSNLSIQRASNIIMGPNFQVADIKASERINLEGGEVEVTAFVMPKSNKPEFRMGNLSFFDSLQELFAPKDIRFESHPYFSDFYLLTSEKEKEVRSLFTTEVLDYLEKHTDYKMEVNDHFILVFQEQRLLNVEEINNLIQFSTELMDMFTENLKHEQAAL
jgi:MFS superfamily sulfate permease-like transporter